jgi:pyruvate/2-oxoglutarate dehydrogenase complex dihydrolipoamide acyltransferase (E2) component
MHLVTKAVADTLKQYPILFSFFTGKEIVDNQEMVISIPVDVEQHVEYIALHNPDDKSLLSIAMETTAELANIRSGKGDFLKNLQRLMENKNESESDPLEFCRQYLGNFVISNFGSFHVDCGTIVIAQPVISGICVGSVKPSVFLQSGQWRETMMLPLTISFDHRPVDGAYVGRFLDSVKKCLESPERLFDNSQL